MINIQHDYSTPHEQIIQIMDTARQVGLVDQIVCGPTSEVAKGAAESSRDEKLFIVVDQDGNMKLKTDKSVTFATLKEELQAKRQLLDNNTMIIIHGDERTPQGQIVQIMDIARQAGLVDQAIAAELQPEANVAVEPSRDEKLFMIVDQDGNMKLNDKSVTFATLKEELQAKRQLAGQYYDYHPTRRACPSRAGPPDHGYRSSSRARRARLSGHRHGTGTRNLARGDGDRSRRMV